MQSRFCHHLHQNGTYCQSPPMRGRDYCYTHLQLIGRRMQMAKARARAEKYLFSLPLPEDLHGVQVAIAHLMDAVAADRVDTARARVLLTALRLAASNLKSKTPWDLRHFEANPAADSRAVDDSNFETNYGLPEGLDLKLPPEVAFPAAPDTDSAGAPPLSPVFGDRACPEPAAGVGNEISSDQTLPSIPVTVADVALWRHLHEASTEAHRPIQQGAANALASLPPDDMTYPPVRLHRQALQIIAEGKILPITPFDIELMEILKSEGNSAMHKRMRQHEIDQRRQEARRQSRAARERLAGEAQARNAAKLATLLLTEKKPPQSETSPATATETSDEPVAQTG